MPRLSRSARRQSRRDVVVITAITDRAFAFFSVAYVDAAPYGTAAAAGVAIVTIKSFTATGFYYLIL